MSKSAAAAAAPPSADEAESKKLKSAAFSRRLLSRAPAKPANPLEPSKPVLKHGGRDIIKKGQRKNKFLFSLPGLISPLSGGKIGELSNLNTRNPVLYLEFPQGRMKLFGTVVYPKNKYLTLQFSKSSKGVLCEDSFENMVVFSEAWWIGKQEENPEEIRLDFPTELNSENNSECDFNAGAGTERENKSNSGHKVKDISNKISAEIEISDGESDSIGTDITEKNRSAKRETPTRQSARTAGKSFKFAESSGDESCSSMEDETKVSELMHGRKNSKLTFSEHKTERSVSPEASEEGLSQSMQKIKDQSHLKNSEDKSDGKRVGLIQAKLSTLFDRAKKISKPGTGTPSQSTRGSGRGIRKGTAKKTSGKAKGKVLDASEDESPSAMNESDQDADDGDEDWTS